MWFEKSSPKKFQVLTPLTPFIATKLTDANPSTKNFNPNPGVKLSKASAAVVLVVSYYFAHDNLMIPASAPLNNPVYGVSFSATKTTEAVFPTEWINLVLPSGKTSES